MESEIEKQKQIEELLIGAWSNEKSHYLWTFHEPDDKGERLLMVIDNQMRTAGAWVPHYTVTYVDEDNIFIDIWFRDKVSQHKIKFISDKVIQIYNPPIDNADNAQRGLIALNKV